MVRFSQAKSGERVVVGRLEFDVQQLKKSLETLDKSFQQAATVMNTKLDSMGQKWDRTGSRVNKSTGVIGRAISKLTGDFFNLNSLVSGITFVALIYGAKQFASQLIETRAQMESIQRVFSAATGSDALGAREFQFARQEANRLGLDLLTTAKSYGKLTAAARGTSLEGEGARKTFTAIATATSALGLSSYEAEGALNALQQMISKGTVQAEELRGQLGERIPGAFNLAAEAMGVTTAELNKMMDRGELLAVDLLPRLADVLTNRYSKAAEEAANSTQGLRNKLSTAWFEFKAVLGGGIVGDSLTIVLQGVTSALGALGDGIAAIENPTKAYIDDLVEQAQSTKSVKLEIEKLLPQYDSLSRKTNLTAEEQGRLNEISERLATIVPGLTIDFDAFGNVLPGTTTNVGQLKNEVERLTKALEDMSKASKAAELINVGQQIDLLTTQLEDIQAAINEVMERSTPGFELKLYTEEFDRLNIQLARLVRRRDELQGGPSIIDSMVGDAGSPGAGKGAAEAAGQSLDQLAMSIEGFVRSGKQASWRDTMDAMEHILKLREMLGEQEVIGGTGGSFQELISKSDANLMAQIEAEYEHRTMIEEMLAELDRRHTVQFPGLQRLAKEAGDVALQIDQAFTSMALSVEDALTEIVVSGKLSFKSLIDAIVSDLARLAIRTLITQPLAHGLSMLAGGLFGALTGGAGAGAAGVTNLAGISLRLNQPQILEGIGGGGSVINVYASPGMDVSMLAQKIGVEQKRMARMRGLS